MTSTIPWIAAAFTGGVLYAIAMIIRAEYLAIVCNGEEP